MYIRVTAHPGAKKESVLKESDTEFTISVKEEAERNLANRRIVQIIAEEFGIEPERIRMISGHRSRRKIINVE